MIPDPPDPRTDLYPVEATGDVLVGDVVRFARAVLPGSYRNARLIGWETVEGVVVSESHGTGTGQHTFTIERPDGSKFRIKGRVLYARGVYRKPWADETVRQSVAVEKHTRGDRARKARDAQHDGPTVY